MNRNAGIWTIAAAVLILVALVIEGLTIQRIGIGPISIDFVANGDGPPRTPNGEPKTTVPTQGSGQSSNGNNSNGNSSNGNPQDTRVVVPNLIGKTKQAAADALEGANLQASFATADGDTPVDQVIRTNPAAGVKVEPRSVVQVKISRGPFAGTWLNEDPNTRNVPQVAIETISATTATVHIWGACTPTWCDWGPTTASSSNGELNATYNPGFATKQVSISRSGEQLVVKIHTHFTDNSGRADYDSTNIMNRK